MTPARKRNDVEIATDETSSLAKCYLPVAHRFAGELRRLGIPQYKLAFKTGLSHVTISTYANGHRLPSAGVLIKLDELGADIRYILTGKAGLHSVSRDSDIHRFELALAEAQRQSISNNEVVSKKALFERAWIIHQAWNALMAGGLATTSTQNGETP